ncbi:hypothetical protein [Undibacterium sp.]|uniref:hypothetical protein n=1 Tax=Undibacterium sp. TaxID=1914977 RepID=UPI00374D4F51
MTTYTLVSKDGNISCGSVAPYYEGLYKWWVAENFHVAANPGDYHLLEEPDIPAETDPPQSPA